MSPGALCMGLVQQMLPGMVMLTHQCPAGIQLLWDPLWDHLSGAVLPIRLHRAGVPWHVAKQAPPPPPKVNSPEGYERR